jgi:hypothetical protein
MIIYELRIFDRQTCGYKAIFTSKNAALRRFRMQLDNLSMWAREIQYAHIYGLKLNGSTHEFDVVSRDTVLPHEVL